MPQLFKVICHLLPIFSVSVFVFHGPSGLTPTGSTPTLWVLLDYGANVDQPDANGRSALHLAALAGHFDCVQVLHATHQIQSYTHSDTFILCEHVFSR